jgi:hypothetical protein
MSSDLLLSFQEAPDATQSQCHYFNGGRNCRVCPGKCPKSNHLRSKEKITNEIITLSVEFKAIVDENSKV